jgi:hypothetical protein
MRLRTFPAVAFVAAALVALLLPNSSAAQTVEVVHDAEGMQLVVDGEPMMVVGMNWAYMPIGENYSYDFWGRSDAFIEEALHTEMGLLAAMGVNAIRQYDVIPPRWVEWIYDEYGIMTALNPLMGRYGMTIDGVWTPNIDYGNPRHREAILAELDASLNRYAGTRGILLWMLGNENNYGLHWTSFEIEALPVDEADPRAVHLYTLMNEGAERVKALAPGHPVSMTNGDLQYIDIIAEVCDAFDIFGTNVYRGANVRDMYEEVYEKMQLPVMFTEFGADAYDARRGREDDVVQAEYLLHQWHDLYAHAHGQDAPGNAIGGFIFQWSEGWWKSGQTVDLDIHNTDASWPNGGYAEDYVEGANNMNEEWFGIAAKDPSNEEGHYRVRPRTAYYVLQQVFTLDPYGATRAEIDAHFASIVPRNEAYRYAALRADAETQRLRRVRVANLRLHLDSSGSTGRGPIERADALTIDHTESFWLDVETEPVNGVYGFLSLNVVGNVAQNRLDDIFYEQRAVGDDEASIADRVGIYGAEIAIERPFATLRGYYRRGHTHWGYEGDFFGLYRETFYGPNLDIYQANAPLGFELEGHRQLEGLKLAFGPEIYWGANPMVIGKYTEQIGPVSLTVMHQEDLASNQSAESSNATPERRNRRTALHLQIPAGRHQLDIAGLMAGTPRIGESFTWTRETDGRGYLDSGYDYLADEVQLLDTLAARAKASFEFGRVNWYVQGGYHGLVADGGDDRTITWQRWSLKETGQGNHYAASSGAAIALGSLTIAPNALYQAPLIGPNPSVDAFYSVETDLYYPSIRPRNVIDDPFAVLSNRETIGAELLLVWDPTPGTWYWLWDRIDREDARFAWSLDFVYRHQPTARDANLVVLESGAVVPFGGSPPAQDEWDLTFDWFARPGPVRLYGTLFAGQSQARGDSARLVTRGGGSVQIDWNTARLSTRLHLHDWGPYDFHRDFNLTYPLQWYGDLSYGVRAPRLGTFDTRFGLRAQARVLNEYSEGWLDPTVGGTGHEVEAGVYVNIGM